MKNKYSSPLDFPEKVPYSKLDYKDIDLDSIVSSKYNNISGVIIISKGEVVLEKYYNNNNINDTFHVASVTKSILSALIGIAIDKGYIKSIDEKVVDFFPEYDDLDKNECRQSITLKNLLTMTAPYDFPDWQEPFDKFCSSPDWTRYILNSLGKNGSIGNFKYSTQGAHLISCILTRAANKSARKFANEYLFSPMGINTIPDYKTDLVDFNYLFGKDLKGWPHDPHGNSTGGWGLNLRLRDMALFGFLYLNDGFYNGKQIVPQSWVHLSTSPFSNQNVFAQNQYGYLWWINHYNNLYCYSAVGDGGNIISCIPEKELVVAISAEHPKPIENPYEFIQNCIIPYI